MTYEQEEAARLFRVYTADAGRIDHLYGKQKATCRAHILSVLHGRKVTASQAGWNAFRDAMFALYGASGECLATQESELRRLSCPIQPLC